MPQGIEFLKNISDFETPISLSSVFLWSVFMLVFLVFAVFSAAIFYHWKKYDWPNRDTKKAAAIYIVGAGVLFIAAFFVIIALE